MNPLVMMQLMSQMQQGGQQGGGMPPVMPQGQQQRPSPSQSSLEQRVSGYSDVDPMMQLGLMQPSSSSILDEGALSAIKSAKTALQMDEGEKNRALGMGLVKLFAGMAKPGYGDGLNGALSALTQNTPSAVDAYTGEEGRVQNMNAALLNHVSQMRAKQQEAWMNAVDKAQERDYKNKTLTETQRHHQRMEDNTKSSHEETRRYHDLWLSDREERAQDKRGEKRQERLKKELDDPKYEAAEAEMHDLWQAEQLLNQGSPLRGNFWSFMEDKVMKKPEFLKNADEAAYDVAAADMKGQTYKRMKYRNQAEFKNIKEIDPKLGKAQNKAIIELRKSQILPMLKQKMAKQAQLEALETGEDWKKIFTRNWKAYSKGENSSKETPTQEKTQPVGSSLEQISTEDLMREYQALGGQ